LQSNNAGWWKQLTIKLLVHQKPTVRSSAIGKKNVTLDCSLEKEGKTTDHIFIIYIFKRSFCSIDDSFKPFF
jgi:hypothetical protein